MIARTLPAAVVRITAIAVPAGVGAIVTSKEPLMRPPALLALAALVPLAACARQVSSAVTHTPDTPGFLLGLWHGFIFPVAWVLSLFMKNVAIYAVPNTGGWYDFGYFIGVVFLGVGARKGGKTVVTRTIYRERR